MYAWLCGAVETGAPIITANQRLCRELHEHYARQMLERERSAWRTPPIIEIRQWVRQLAEFAADIPKIQIGQDQAQIVWERVLREELADRDANISRLARYALRTRDRLADHLVAAATVGEYAFAEDHRLFANALNRYLQFLSRQNWTDRAGLQDDVLQALRERRLQAPAEIWMAGFVHRSPRLDALLDALRAQGCRVHEVQPDYLSKQSTTVFLEDQQELRAAGHWARRQVEENPQARVGIVVLELEERAYEITQAVREGFCPGWQLHREHSEDLVNVSYGRRMLDYPAIHTALLSLRWMLGTLNAAEIATLLRSDWIGDHRDHSRIKTEVLLRNTADREWSIGAFLAEFGGAEDSVGVLLQKIEIAAEGITEHKSSPEVFAEQFDTALQNIGWPGESALSSRSFQLINRWREALNQFAGTGTVEPTSTVSSALSRLSALVADSIFQPKSTSTGIDVLGPLEAVGMEFDALWIAGLSAENWPGHRQSDPLLARELQIAAGMPNGQPERVLAASAELFSTLCQSGREVVLSFSQFDGDAERSVSPLLPANLRKRQLPVPDDFAESMLAADSVQTGVTDPVPPVTDGERVFGGAAAIDRQATSPFDAFAMSRLGVEPLWPFQYGLSPKDRGIFVHEALARFYTTGLSKKDIQGWGEEGARQQALTASAKTFQRAFHGKSKVQRKILRLEEARIVQLLRDVWRFDCRRSDDFLIAQIEQRQSIAVGVLQLHLQADRIDRLAGGGLMILDYKTGTEKRLLSKGDLTSFQLILYAMANQEETSAIALYNVNSSGMKLHGAGSDFAKKGDVLAENRERWIATALAHADNLIDGDVRVLAQQTDRDSRRTGLLSRVQELKRDS